MSYARARLWLGITGVGSLVTFACISLMIGLPEFLFADQSRSWSSDLLQLVALTGVFMLWLLPFDFLGGFFLPGKYEKSNQTFSSWAGRYLIATFSQALIFVLFGFLIISLSRAFGQVGGITTVCLGMIVCLLFRDWIFQRRSIRLESSSRQLLEAMQLVRSWQIPLPRTFVVSHEDIGFTGGIIGFGNRAQIVIPKAWLSFTREQLAAAIARRAMAIHRGSYSRGLVLAFAWNMVGFLLCSWGFGVSSTSVEELFTICCGFTFWSFLGLLTLPTLSRNASLNIDKQLLKQGVSTALISDTALQMDRFQDEEPRRSRWIETIFHPVPNVSSRNSGKATSGLAAWNVARTTLFFSWACLGFLSRSVHCNVGRPELWTMLPSD